MTVLLVSTKPRRPAEAEARPPVAPEAAVRVRLPAPRCPYCHDDVLAGEPQHGCPGCRAWHHASCWSERAGCCAACGRDDGHEVDRARELVGRLGLRRHERLPVPWTLLGAWVLLMAAIPAAQGLVLPAFREMFLEVGLRLPWITQVVLGPWGWLLALLPFTALFLGAVSGTPRGRDRGGGAAMLLTLALGLGYTYALISPLISVFTRL